MLAPPLRLALNMGAWFVLQGISTSSECASVGSAIGVGSVIIWAWRVLRGISKRSQFPGVGYRRNSL